MNNQDEMLLSTAFKSLKTGDAALAQTTADLNRAMNAFVRNNAAGHLAALISAALSNNNTDRLPASVTETWQLPKDLSQLYRDYQTETRGLWHKSDRLTKAFAALISVEPLLTPPYTSRLDVWNAALKDTPNPNEAHSPNSAMDALIIAMGGDKWQPAYVAYLQECVNPNPKTGRVTEFAKVPLTPLQWVRSGA
jgi:hypothetical protein|tara:strand:+ start:1860 stop:2441 length:582 start_codon:yes stop_codon:yes gene_type:complete